MPSSDSRTPEQQRADLLRRTTRLNQDVMVIFSTTAQALRGETEIIISFFERLFYVTAVLVLVLSFFHILTRTEGILASLGATVISTVGLLVWKRTLRTHFQVADRECTAGIEKNEASLDLEWNAVRPEKGV